jgi:putative ABC transport system permease protein
MSGAMTDVRYGVRALIRRPGITLPALVVLTLGLGAQAAIVAVVDAVLLRPLPYHEPHRLVALRQYDAEAADARGLISPAAFLEWRDGQRACQQVAAVRPWTFTWRTDRVSRQISAGLVSEGFFELLGVRAVAGRTLMPEDYRPGAPRAVVIADRLWRDLFGRDPSVIGRPVQFGNDSLTIAGVLPESFWWFDRQHLMWGAFPLTERARQLRAQTYLTAIGRLASNRSAGEAEHEIAALAARLKAIDPRVYGDVQLHVSRVHDDVTAEVRPGLWMLFGAVALVSLIAFGNFAGLMIVRGTERLPELQVRAALGAGPLRLVRQLFVEHCLLVGLAAVAGLLAARSLLAIMVAQTPVEVPRLGDAAIDGRTVALSSMMAGLVAVGAGLLPTLRLVRRRSATPGVAARQLVGRGSTFTRRWLVSSQVALTFVLLVGAALLATSFVRVTRVDPGFSAANVALVELHVWSSYPQPVQQVEFFDAALAHVRRLPGVTAAGATSAPPFLGGPSIEIETTLTPVGIDGDRQMPAWLTIATPGYVEALRIPLREGRTFTDRDRAGSPRVAVISQTLASRAFGDAAIGKRIRVANERTPEPLEVIGVVADLRHVGLDRAARDDVYVPLTQAPFGSMNLVVRAAADPATLTPAVLGVLRQIDPAQAVTVRLLEQLVRDTIAPRRFNLTLAAWLGGTALVLATVAMYGLISFVTSQRTREIGLRMALGGERSHVWRVVLRSALQPPAIGIVIGAVVALASGRLIRARLFGVEDTDVATFAGVAGLILLVAVLAAAVPGRRAMRIDPVRALREE